MLTVMLPFSKFKCVHTKGEWRPLMVSNDETSKIELTGAKEEKKEQGIFHGETSKIEKHATRDDRI
jgi:hypothetical protein